MAQYAEGATGHRTVVHPKIDDDIAKAQADILTALAKNEGLTPKGNWTAGTAYKINELVLASGVLFRVLVNHTAPATAPTISTPTANYETWASAANTGNSIVRRDGAGGVVLGKVSVTATTPDADNVLTTRSYVLTQINTVATNSQSASYTLVLDDLGKVVEQTEAAATTISVPSNAAVAYPVGAIIQIRQYGTGQITITGATGVTIRSRGAANKTAGQYAEAALTKRAADEWILSGDIVV